MDVFFSIVLPVYNSQAYIERTINQLLSQTYPSFEILVVDDGSTDSSLSISKAAALKDSRVRVFHKPNGGASSARNYALEKIQGNYVVFCDADDEVGEKWLQSFVDKIRHNEDIVVAGFVYETINAEKYIPFMVSQSITPLSLAEKLSIDNTFGYLWNKCFKAEIISKFHIRFDENAIFLEDEEFVGNFWRHVKTICISDSTEYHYQVPNFDKKYVGLDNYAIYLKMLKYASEYVPLSNKSEMLRKYTMGCFRCMLLSFQKQYYIEGWRRLREFVIYGQTYKAHNKYMKWITKCNYIFWYPLLIVYTAIKK